MKTPSRRYWHEHRGAAFWIVCLLLVVWRAYAAKAPSGPERLDEGVHEVRRVVDGDTILLASGARVRLQGVNTPETVMKAHPIEAWGPEASQFAKDFIEKAGHRVRLTFSLERKDRDDQRRAGSRRPGLRSPRLPLRRHDETPLDRGSRRSPQGRAGYLVHAGCFPGRIICKPVVCRRPLSVVRCRKVVNI